MEEQDPDADEYNNQDYSLEEKGSKVSWIVNRGIDVGKKILVTSFLISSAPIVLPPLVVISVIGFAVSVPSGLLLASYACTDKLMNKLLPGTRPSPFLLGYGTEEFEDDEGGEGADSGLVEHIDMEKGQQEELEDMKRTVEMRIDLSKYGDEENGNSGYEEEAGDYVNNKTEGEPSQEVEVEIDGVNQEEESLTPLLVDEPGVVVVDIGGDERVDKDGEESEPSFEVSNVVIGLCENDDIEEDKELVKETRGLLEKIRDEGLTNNEEGDQTLDRDARKMSKPVEDVNGFLRESEPKIEGNKHKTLEASLESQNKGFDGEADVIPVEMKTENAIEGLSLARDIDDILQAEISVTEMSGTTKVTTIKEERQKLVEANYNFSDVVGQDVELNRKKNLEIVDDSGFYLLDNKEMSGQRVSDSDYYSAIEGIVLEQSTSYKDIFFSFIRKLNLFISRNRAIFVLHNPGCC